MGHRIPEADIERVKRSTDLVVLVRSRGIELQPQGAKDFIGRCPFHADHQTPNFIVTPDQGFWHCMVCGHTAASRATTLSNKSGSCQLVMAVRKFTLLY